MKQCWLLRHGKTEANARRLYCGAADVPLSDEGKWELLRLKNTRQYPPLQGANVYTSGLRRTEETLFLLYGAVAHETLPGFQELHFGQFELHSYEELKKNPDYLQWISGDNKENCCPGGESGQEMERRVLRTFRGLQDGQSDFLVICHGGPISAIMERLFPNEQKTRCEWQPAGGEGYHIVFSEGKPVRYEKIPLLPANALL